MTVPESSRVDPPRIADERPMLDAWLDYYRASLLHKCAGLSAEQLVERSCPPSPMSLIGLVRHMTEMERGYAHRLADPGLPLHYCTEEREDGDFEDVSAAAAVDDLKIFAEHCERSREIMADPPLDRQFGSLGHADLLRERVDGIVGE
jgi:hypothetical protein